VKQIIISMKNFAGKDSFFGKFFGVKIYLNLGNEIREI
jgi:hypothetical protein